MLGITPLLRACLFASFLGASALAQVDQERAAQYFAEAEALCQRDAGALWGVSLCGPMVFADPITDTLALNRERPEADKPRLLGFANTALEWGNERWSTFVWQMVDGFDDQRRARVMMHELFHRVQPELGLMINQLAGNCDHLDTLEGRYWIQLEWRALAAALEAEGPAQRAALSHALAFRARRRALGDGFAERERGVEINEGLAQYTGTVLASRSRAAARTSGIAQLRAASDEESFVRSFAYPTGAALGLLLDDAAPAWRTTIMASDDLGELLAAAMNLEPARDVESAVWLYRGDDLRAAEEAREAERAARAAALSARFVDGPVIVMPRGRNASFITAGVTPLGDVGTIYPSFRVTGPWGSVVADQILMSADGRRLTVPGPPQVAGAEIRGDGWTITLADGWMLAPAERAGDHAIMPTHADDG